MELNFKLPIEMVNAILDALAGTPYRTAAPIIATLQQQAQPQMQPQLVAEQEKNDGAA